MVLALPVPQVIQEILAVLEQAQQVAVQAALAVQAPMEMSAPMEIPAT